MFKNKCDGPLGETIYIKDEETGKEVPRVKCLTCEKIVYGYNHEKSNSI